MTCNLRCRHCYEADAQYPTGCMSIELFESIIEKLKGKQEVQIVWFGGEPMLCGLDFFRQVVLLQNKHKHIKFKNVIQTNGTLLNDEWLDFFEANKFHVAISYDGIFNDILRQQTEIVEANLRHVLDRGINVGIITTLIKENISRQIQLYEFFKELGLSCKFNRLFVSGKGKKNAVYAIDDEEYFKSQVELFDYWVFDKNAKNILNFTKIINSIFCKNQGECTSVGCLYKWLCINPKGDIFTCSRFYEDEYRICNVSNISAIDEVFQKERYEEIAQMAIARIKQCLANNCGIYPFCNGGCNGLCKEELNSLSYNASSLCTFRKKFIPYVIQKFNAIVDNQLIDQCNPFIQKYLSSQSSINWLKSNYVKLFG